MSEQIEEFKNAAAPAAAAAGGGAGSVSAIANAANSLFNAIGSIVGGIQQRRLMEQDLRNQNVPGRIDFYGNYRPPTENAGKDYTVYIVLILALIIVAALIFKPKKQ